MAAIPMTPTRRCWNACNGKDTRHRLGAVPGVSEFSMAIKKDWFTCDGHGVALCTERPEA